MKILLNITFLLGCCAVFAQHPFSYISTSNEAGYNTYGDTIGLDGVELHGTPTGQFNLGGAGSVTFPLLLDLNYFNTNAYTLLAFQDQPAFERYKVAQPITDVKYIIGSNKEQFFDVLHAQNMGKMNFSVGLKKVSNEGFYLNQNTNNTHVFANVNHLGKKYFYTLDFDVKQKLQGLNGGFKEDSLFIQDSLSPSTLYEVNLLNASQQIRQTNYRFLQEFTFSDSYDSTTQTRIKSKLIHSVGYQSQTRNYYDTLGTGETSLSTDYYNGFTIDSVVTNDDLKYQRFYSTVAFQYVKDAPQAYFRAQAGLTPSYNIVRRTEIEDTAVFDLETEFNFNYSDQRSTRFYKHYKLRFKYLVNDQYDDNDYELDAAFKTSGSAISFKVEANSKRQRPQLDLLQYAGNSASWNSSLEKTTLNKIGIQAEMLHSISSEVNIKPQVFVHLYDQKNPIFFGYDGRPQQVNGFAQVITSGVDLDIKTKSWNFKTKAVYQYQGGFNVFRLPEFYSNLQIGKNFSLFRKKMKLTAGLSITYFSKYNSKFFDAASGQFLIGTDHKVGGYPFADVFIKGRVQKVTYFIMSSHPHEGLLGNNYFTAPGYAANGRMLKLGINWLFLN